MEFFKTEIQGKDLAVFMSIEPIGCDIVWNAMDNISCITAIRGRKEYIDSDFDDEFRITCLGEWTVDQKEMVAYLTAEPTNEKMHRHIKFADTHVRDRPFGTQRHGDGALPKRKIGWESG